MQPEDAVYICGWSQTEDGFEVWVKVAPDGATARGTTCEAAIETFLDVIIKRGGAYLAPFWKSPPSPSDFDRRYSQPAIVAISGDERYETDEPKRTWFEPPEERVVRESWYDGLFEVPLCRKCHTPRGARNRRPLHLTWAKENRALSHSKVQASRCFPKTFDDALRRRAPPTCVPACGA